MYNEKQKLSIRIRHHYIPQMYLQGFSEDGEHLYVLDKKTENVSVRFRRQAKMAIAYENHLYTYDKKDGTKGTLEDFFCEIEGRAKAILSKFSRFEQISDEERSYFSIFLSYLWLRTPVFKDNSKRQQTETAEKMIRMIYHVPQQKERMRKFFEKKDTPKTDEELDDLIDFMANEKRSKIELSIPQNYWLKQMLMLGNDLYPVMAIFDWEIRHTREKYAYITSDNPFFIIPNRKPDPFEGVGLLTVGAKKIVTLSSNMCLVMHEPCEHPRLVYHEASKNFFRKINLWVYKNADRTVFSPILGKIEKMYKQYGNLCDL